MFWYETTINKEDLPVFSVVGERKEKNKLLTDHRYASRHREMTCAPPCGRGHSGACSETLNEHFSSPPHTPSEGPRHKKTIGVSGTCANSSLQKKEYKTLKLPKHSYNQYLNFILYKGTSVFLLFLKTWNTKNTPTDNS